MIAIVAERKFAVRVPAADIDADIEPNWAL
jgi:hypothetical protein